MAHRKKVTARDEPCERSSLRESTEHRATDAGIVFSSPSSSDEEVAAACHGGHGNNPLSDRFVKNRDGDQATG